MSNRLLSGLIRPKNPSRSVYNNIFSIYISDIRSPVCFLYCGIVKFHKTANNLQKMWYNEGA